MAEGYHGTTIVCVRREGRVALGGDGQVSIGDSIMKSNATKVRTLKGGRVLAGFAGSVADALTSSRLKRAGARACTPASASPR